MISRVTARVLAELISESFKSYHSAQRYGRSYWYSDSAKVYDFLYENEFPAWLCNAARKACSTSSLRPLKDFLMKLHTGESQYQATKDWTWPQRQVLGQQYLHQLAEVILNHWEKKGDGGSHPQKLVAESQRLLELDGFVRRGSHLLVPEQDILDVREEAGVLEQLYVDLGLADRETAMHHLQLSVEHYTAQRWDDSIGNSRKFLECVLREVARSHSLHSGSRVGSEALGKPAKVRDYLEQNGLLETKERGALASTYGLLSETGGHPYMARNEQARLLRHLALTFGQFAMLRLEGFLRDQP